MTEDEAKTKWCPMSRVHNTAAVNRDYKGVPKDSSMCLGTGCMMWRWHQVKNEEHVPDSGFMSTTPKHPGDFISPWKDSATDGYCGMAR